jgi:hypothetical protein
MFALSRRWLRFRMRGLLAFMALCAAASKLASHVTDYHAEQRVLAELRKSGVSFHVEGPLSIFL